MTDKFRKLKGLMREKGIIFDDLVKVLNRSKAYINARMNAYNSFPLDEAYKICDYLGIDQKDLPIYFPPGGLSKN